MDNFNDIYVTTCNKLTISYSYYINQEFCDYWTFKHKGFSTLCTAFKLYLDPLTEVGQIKSKIKHNPQEYHDIHIVQVCNLFENLENYLFEILEFYLKCV